MRGSGDVLTARGLLPDGHLCWAYRDRAEFGARVREFLADGLAAGLWVEYVGPGTAAQLRTELAAFVGDLPTAGVGVRPIDEFYVVEPGRNVVDPVASVAARVAAGHAAVAAGHAGFRALVDATAMARTPPQRRAVARFEYLIDQQMAVLPISALCAYDRTELGPDAVAELACLHPHSGPGSAPFRLHADHGVDLALAGDVDLVGRELFLTTLERIADLPAGPDLIVDVARLDFIDHRGLAALDAHAREHGRTLWLHHCSPGLARVVALLELRHLHPVVDR